MPSSLLLHGVKSCQEVSVPTRPSKMGIELDQMDEWMDGWMDGIHVFGGCGTATICFAP